LRISQVLPQNTVNEDLPETKSYEDAERKVRAEVEAIKKAPDTTKSLMQLAYYEELKEHEERLNRYAKKAKAYNERLHIIKDFNNK
jgi:FtsZ-binding cell division protein ZapB